MPHIQPDSTFRQICNSIIETVGKKNAKQKVSPEELQLIFNTVLQSYAEIKHEKRARRIRIEAPEHTKITQAASLSLGDICRLMIDAAETHADDKVSTKEVQEAFSSILQAYASGGFEEEDESVGSSPLSVSRDDEAEVGIDPKVLAEKYLHISEALQKNSNETRNLLAGYANKVGSMSSTLKHIQTQLERVVDQNDKVRSQIGEIRHVREQLAEYTTLMTEVMQHWEEVTAVSEMPEGI
jgi:hypothetical protein